MTWFLKHSKDIHLIHILENVQLIRGNLGTLTFFLQIFVLILSEFYMTGFIHSLPPTLPKSTLLFIHPTLCSIFNSSKPVLVPKCFWICCLPLKSGQLIETTLLETTVLFSLSCEYLPSTSHLRMGLLCPLHLFMLGVSLF